MISSKTFAIAGIVFALLAADAAAFSVIGHRGARGLSPENTIIGFQHGVQVGADVVEADVVMTADKQVIVRHDLRVSGITCRGPYFNRFYKNLTLTQVRRLDCGTRRVADTLASTQVPQPGAHVPTLSQVYRAVPSTPVLVEAKIDPYAPRDTYAPHVVARHVVEAIRKARAVRRTTVQSFDWRVLREIGRREPRLKLQGLVSAVTLFPGSRWLGGVRVRSSPFRSGLPSAVQRAGFEAIAVPSAKATQVLIDAAHGRGLKVTAFTVDNPERMGVLIGRGIDGIITDFPDRAAALRR